MTAGDDADHRDGHHGAPHPPAPPEGRRLPHPQMVLRGAGLAALAGTLAVGGVRLARSAGPLAFPLVIIVEISGLLAAWAAAIHLTGGERFDDHPWV